MSQKEQELKQAREKGWEAADFMASIVLGFFALAVFNAWAGVVVSVLWGWFVVPAFGVPELHPIAAMGLCLIAAAIQKTGATMRGAGTMPGLFLVNMGGPATALAMGWIAKSFI